MAVDGCSLALNLLTAARIEVDWETERVVGVMPPFVAGGRRVPVTVGTGTTSKGLRSRGVVELSRTKEVTGTCVGAGTWT